MALSNFYFLIQKMFNEIKQSPTVFWTLQAFQIYSFPEAAVIPGSPSPPRSRQELVVFFFFLATCEIFVPQPRIEPVPPAVEARSLTHWTAREVPRVGFLFFGLYSPSPVPLPSFRPPLPGPLLTSFHPVPAMQDPPGEQRPILWAPKWVDYSSKYGFGYQLSDGGSGVLLRDGTHMALRPAGR